MRNLDLRKLMGILVLFGLLLNSFGEVNAQTYCTPTYSTGCTVGDMVNYFSLNTITESITCTTPSYQDHTSLSTNLTIGDTYNLVVAAGYSSTYFKVWIDFNNNYTFDASEVVADGVCSSSSTNYTFPLTIPMSATPTSTRLRIRTNYASAVGDPCTSYTYGNAIDYTVIMNPLGDNDLGVFGVTPSTICSGPTDFYAIVRNYGGNTVNNYKLDWSLDGVAQTQITITDSLQSGEMDTVLLSNINFVNSMYDFVIYTSLPNGIADTLNYNDTLTLAPFFLSLNGTYSIGATGDFADFAAAVNALSVYGICGPVVFEVESGTYNENISLGEIPGVSAINTVTFKSASGVNTDVILTYNASSTTNNWVVNLDGGDYYSFEDMTLKSTNGTYGRVVRLYGGAHHNTFDGCILQAPVSSTSSNYMAVVVNESGVGDSANVFMNNDVKNGSYGFYMYGGSSSSFEPGNVISHNNITNFYYYGVYLYYQYAPIVEYNTIETGLYTYAYPVYTYYVRGPFQFVGNKIHTWAGSYNYGLRLYYTDGAPGVGLVANNFITSSLGTGTCYGLYVYYASNIDIFNNSVNIPNGNTTSAGLYMYQGSSPAYGNIRLTNNSFVNTGGGYAIQIHDYAMNPGMVTYQDYNNYYGTGATPIAFGNWNVTTMADLNLIEPHSMMVDPAYLGVGDLHSYSALLNGAGKPLASVPFDIDMDPRDPIHPTIGADEYTLYTNDAGVLSFVGIDAICPGLTPVSALVQNFGLVELTEVAVNWTVNGVAQTTLMVYDTIAVGGNMTVYLGDYTFLSGTVYDVIGYTSMPNGVVDPGNSNDTTSLIGLQTAAAGTFTVGATGDFATITDAQTFIENFGVCGPVIFNILPGTYNEQVTINVVSGVDATNTVTWQSSTGNNTDVVVQYAPSGLSDNWVWRMNGADYNTVNNITLKNIYPSGSTIYGRVVDLNGVAEYNTFHGCILEGVQGSSTSNYYAIIYDYYSGGLNNYNTFSDNQILNGSYAIYAYGSGGAVGNKYLNNNIEGYYYYGLYCYYQNEVQIKNNTILQSPAGYTYNYPVYAYYCDGAINVSGNYIYDGAGSYFYGLRIYYCDATSTARGLVSNNMIATENNSSTQYGLYVYNSSNQDIYNNSVSIKNGGTNYACYLYHSNATAYGTYNFINNSIVNHHTSGYCLYGYGLGLAALTSSNNNLYTNSSTLCYFTTTYATLSDWQGAGFVGDVLNTDGGYLSGSNLHSNSLAMDGAGMPLAEVTVDIDGDTRDPFTPDVGADEYILANDDAAITALPGINSMCPGTVDVVATVSNYGLVAMNSVVINWSVNGVLQTPFTYNTTIPISSSADVVIGQYTMVAGTTYSFTVWSSLPNGNPDPNASNDSYSVSGVTTSVFGTYTIGATGDFTTFADAVAFISAAGICGPIVFNIETGVYTEQVTIPNIVGASATNTITFQPLTGNQADVVVQYSATSTSDNWVWSLSGVDYCTVQNIKMKPLGASYAVVLQMAGVSDYNTISNCILEGVVASSTSSYFAVIYDYYSTGLNNYNTYIDNQILNGSYAIYAYGSGGAYGNKYINNYISNYYYYGMYLYYQYDVVVDGNTVLQSPTGYSYNYPIYVYYSDYAIQVTNNYIYDGAGTYMYGLRVYYSDATASAPGLVANNMVISENNSYNYGLYIYNSMYQNVYNNSVRVAGGTTNYGGYIYLSNATSYGTMDIKNNSIANFGTGGYCLYGYGSGLAAQTFSNNNLFTNSSTLCYYSTSYSDVSSWNTATGGNDISYDPEYIAYNDLHTFSLYLNGAGTPLPEVTTDYDGDVRDPLHPDIGADEFNLLLPPNELAVTIAYTLGQYPMGAGDNHVVKAIVKNLGNDTQYNVPVTLTVSGANSFTTVATIDSITFAGVDTVQFSPFTATTIGLDDVTVTVPPDMDSTNNSFSYWQNVNANQIAYADTSASVLNLGYNTGQGMLLCKYHINGASLIQSVGAYIVGNTTSGNSLYGIVLDAAGNLLSQSAPITITTVDSLYLFPVLDTVATNTVNDDVYVGIVQTWGSAGYYPLGVQEEIPARRGAYYIASAAGVAPTEDASFGRFMIGAVLTDPPPYDAACTNISSPIGGCGLGMEDVTIDITNMGSSDISGGLTVFYQLGTNPPVSEGIPTATIIPSGTTYTYTFGAQANLAVLFDSTFTLTAWVSLTGDTYLTNDTSETTIESLYQPASPSGVNTTVLYGSMATLSVLSSDSIYWFDDPLATNNIGTGTDITIGPLYDTTSLWAIASTLSTGDIQIGTGTSTTGTSSYPNPYCTYYYGNKEQMLIRAEELVALGFTGGNINSIAFNVFGVSSYSLTNFELKIGSTTATTLTTWQTGLTSVFFDPSHIPSMGWNLHPFTAPFVWDGVSNIVIETCFNNSAWTSGGSIQYSTTSFTSCLNYHADNTTVCSSTTATTYANRPNMVFNVEVPGCLTAPVEVTAFVANIPQNDIGVIAAYSPTSGSNLTNSEVISVEINNWGSADANLFQISYDITGTTAASASEFVINPILSGTSATFDFATVADLSLYGTYNICVYTQMVGDGFASNDTLCLTVENLAPVYCLSGATSSAYEEIVQVNLSNLSNTSIPTGSLYTNYNNTVSPATLTLGNSHPISITSDFAPGYSTSYNCWVEVYVDWDNDGTYTEPGEIAFSSAITSSQTVSGMVTVPVNANLGNHSMRVVLEQTTSATGVIPCGTYTYGETEDYQVYVQPPFMTDAGAINILSPAGSMLENSVQPVEAVVFNFGTQTITNMNVVYTVNGLNPVTTAYVGSLPTFTADTISLGDLVVPGGSFDLCVSTVLLNDSSALNNTVCHSLFADPQYDLAILSIDAPLGGCDQGMEDVVVTFTNIGDTVFGNLPISYYDSSMTAPVTETYTGTLLPGDTASFTFNTQIDLTVTAFTEFYIMAWLGYVADPIATNDSTMLYITSDVAPPPASADDILVWAGTSGVMTVNNPDTTLFYEWFDENNLSLSDDTFYQTPVLFDTTTVYLMASSGSMESADISTTFAGGNGQTGNMFDVTAYTNITLDSFYVNVSSTGIMEVWWREGSYIGFTGSNAGWNLLGSANVVNSGTNIPDLLSVGGLEIPAGETYGLYVTFVTGSVAYTNGNGTNQVYQDDNIKIETGYGGSYFSLTFTPRVWNGTIFYTAGAPGCGSSLTPVTAFVQYADYDGAVLAITSPVSGSNLNNVAVSADIYNNGLLPLSNFLVEYVVLGSLPVFETCTTTVQPGQMINFTFADSINASVFGTYDLCVKTLVTNDGYTANDEVCTSFANWDGNGESCATAFPYLLINDPPVYQTTIHPYDRQWWRFELPVDASDVYVSLCGSSFDTKLEVHNECPQTQFSTSSFLGYNDNSCGNQSQIHFNNMSAGVYWAKVYGATTAFGDYVLEITGTLDAISVVTFAVTQIDCNGAANGAIDATVTPIIPGATLPLSYLWSNGATGLSLTGLAPGTYILNITDATGIPQAETVIISEPPALVVSLAGTDATTLGGNDGSITTTVSGGVSPYQFMWSNQATTQNIAAAYAGIYTVTVFDANGCSTEESVTINSPLPPGWVVTPTANSHLIIVSQNSDITLDAVPAAYGSLIGVFSNQNGIMVCSGWAYWSGMATSVTAYGATPPMDNGYQPGENFVWRLYEANLGVEYGGPACYLNNYPNLGTYVTGGFSGINCLNAQSIIIQPIALPTGWSIWSTYIDPLTPNMAALFSNIATNVTIVKSGSGAIYWPIYNLNTIGNLVMGQGYQVKMVSAQTLEVEGLLIDPVMSPVTIPGGWSIMGYLRTSPMNAATVISPIVSNVVIVKSGGGQIYWPLYNLNTIGNMVPGQGYQIKMTATDVLTFAMNTAAPSKSDVIDVQPEKYNKVNNTGHNMSLGILEDAWSKAPKEGDEIGVFNATGELIGSTVYQNGFNAITLWGDDSYTEDKTEGIANGDVFTLKLWDNTNDTEQELVVQSWLQGSNQYGKDAIAVIEKLLVKDGNFDGFTLFQNVPNPFKDVTEISFYLPETSQVKLVVYNALGEKIEELVSARYEAGRHTVVFKTSSLSSGTYYYNFVSEKFTETKVMNIQ
ncbi:MAG: right-handed parallel beta-helix repeat-containing protein [Bacteroidales bacterium]|nr:right-handed parallel beta-helix repeat-containing protein [Bacteroidales bacterium]MCF8457647.1 right-handed parallel beta-helix repeat-containing protein [Bacteroidales bacterium]